MTRLRYDGAEGPVNASDATWANVGWVGAGASLPTKDTTVFRSGLASWRCNTGATPSQSYLNWASFVPAANLTYYIRFYLRTTMAAPDAATALLYLVDQGGATILLNQSGGSFPAGSLRLVNSSGLFASAPINDGLWHRIEYSFTMNAGGTAYIANELRVDGVTVEAFSGFSNPNTGALQIGFADSNPLNIGTNRVINIDDVAVNNSSGASQNSWPGDGKIILMYPISDNARGTNWLGGAGGTTALWDAVNNMPPIGAAVGTNLSQIHNIVKDTVGNYDANMQSYTAAGVPAGSVINAVRALIDYGGTAGGGAYLLVSNPQANGGVETTISPSSAVGAWPTNWGWHTIAAQLVSSPAVVLSTSPVLRVGKRISSTAELAIDGMFLLVEYFTPLKSLVVPGARQQQIRQQTRWH